MKKFSLTDMLHKNLSIGGTEKNGDSNSNNNSNSNNSFFRRDKSIDAHGPLPKNERFEKIEKHGAKSGPINPNASAKTRSKPQRNTHSGPIASPKGPMESGADSAPGWHSTSVGGTSGIPLPRSSKPGDISGDAGKNRFRSQTVAASSEESAAARNGTRDGMAEGERMEESEKSKFSLRSHSVAEGIEGAKQPLTQQELRAKQMSKSNSGIKRQTRESADTLRVSHEDLVRTAEDLMLRLSGDVAEDQAEAAEKLREMGKSGHRHTRALLESGAMQALLDSLRNQDQVLVEHAVTTVLNLCLDPKGKEQFRRIPGSLSSIVHVLTNGVPQAKSNAAAMLCCITPMDGARVDMVEAGALPGLVQLLREGDKGAKKDAINCILGLSVGRETRVPVAQSGVVPLLCTLVQDGEFDLDEQAAGIFATLVRVPEGRDAMFAEGAIGPLADLLECGSTDSSKEYAVTALLGLAVNSTVCLEAIIEQDVAFSLDALSRSTHVNTQGKATALLEVLKKLSEGEE